MPIELGDVYPRVILPCETCGADVNVLQGSIPRHDHVEECVIVLAKRVIALEQGFEASGITINNQIVTMLGQSTLDTTSQ